MIPWLGALVLVAHPANAGPKKAVKQSFAEWQALGTAYDPAVADLYLPDARLQARRTRADGQVQVLTLDGQQWRDMVAMLMKEAQAVGDQDTFTQVKLTREDAGWRVTAHRANNVKCTLDTAFNQLWVQDAEGSWRIREEQMDTWELSSCEGAGTPLAQVLELQRRALTAMLPIQIDDVSVMTGVQVTGANLIYQVSLPEVPVANLDVGAFGDTIQSMARASACGSRDPRLLLDLGATLVVAYTDRDGVLITEARTTLADCP